MELEQIRNDIIDYLKQGNPQFKEVQVVPMDESLVELGYMDSFGVVDIIIYLEKKYNINIEDEEINKEKFGSINKMSLLVVEKLKGY